MSLGGIGWRKLQLKCPPLMNPGFSTSLVVAMAGWFLLVVTLGAEERQFTDTQGRTIVATILDVSGDEVTLRRADGASFTCAITLFGDEDRAWLRSWTAPGPSGPSYGDLNAWLGVDLFVDDRLWDDPPAEVAKRLDWPREFEADGESSYRDYPAANARLAGLRPRTGALYGTEGRPDRLLVVFANQGDLDSAAELARLDQQMENEAAQLRAGLTSLLGEPTRGALGRSGDMRERAERWDWSGHAFLLVHQPGSYVALRLLPPDVADAGGIATRQTAAALKAKRIGSIHRRPGGDVILTGIPMVDQGPKGYCAPATFERAMRSMGIPADMYLLALAGGTGPGGGTTIRSMVAGIRRYVGSYGRDVDELRGGLDVRTVARAIDQGTPILWGLLSTPAFNAVADARTRERARLMASDPEAWKQRCRDERKRAAEAVPRDLVNAHICMITGYNAETGEIALSDSWGPAFEERWVLPEQAEQISLGVMLIIDY